MNTARILAMAFPDEPKVDGPTQPQPPRLTMAQPDPLTAWQDLQRLIQTTPGLDLATDGQGGVWLREPDEWGRFEDAQRLFLLAMPEIAKTLGRFTPRRREGRPLRVNPALVRVWRTARAWLLPRMDSLKMRGWTTRRLFAAGRTQYPHGEWGVAWSSNWIRPGVKVELRGPVIVWTWKEATQTRTQSAKP